MNRQLSTTTRVVVAAAAVITLVLASAAVFGITGCGRNAEGEGGSQHAAAGVQGSARDGRRGPRQPAVPVAVEAATTGAIASYYTATATLEAEKEAEILARVTGVVEALRCEEGDVVAKGDVLLQIDPREFDLRVEQAAANTSNLRDRYERMKNMFEQQLVSAEEYEDLKNQLKAAEAAEGLARLDLSYTTVRSPFKGRVVQRLVDVGQNVSTGTALFVVSDFDPLLAVGHVPSKEFKKLKPDQPVELVLDSNQTRLQGRIKLVSPIIDPSSGTIKVTIEIPEYPPGTRPGDFAEVRIVTEHHDNSTLIPKNAVFTDMGDQIVFVAADSTAERRVV
ncbi:MAG: efflux RND transporter periplasmic adaptor subunit, partial [bacterium]